LNFGSVWVASNDYARSSAR